MRTLSMCKEERTIDWTCDAYSSMVQHDVTLYKYVLRTNQGRIFQWTFEKVNTCY